MGKKNIMIILSIVILILSVGCKKTEDVPAVSDVVVAPEQVVEKEETQVVDPLEMLAGGKIPEVKFPLGTAGDEIALRLGDPDSEDWFTGHYLQYGGTMFFTDGESSDRRGNLTAILIAQEGSAFGQKVGTPVKDVRAVFGNPSETGWMPAESELFPGEWFMSYTKGDYVLSVYATSDKGTVSGFMMSRNQ